MATRIIRNWWWVDFRVNGTRHRIRSPENARAGAKAYEAVIRRKMANGEPLRAAPVARFDAFTTEWFSSYVLTNNKPSEQQNKRLVLARHLVPAFGSLPLDRITAERIERYKAQKLTSLAPKTVNIHLGILMKCLRTAEDWGRIGTVPKVKPLRAISIRLDFLSREDTEALIADPVEPAWAMMARVAARTGLRFGELIGLEWPDVDLERGQITVRRSIVRGIVGTPKNHHTRHVPLNPDVYRLLAAVRRPAGLVFARADGSPLSYENARSALRRLCWRSGIRPVTWHVLRHTFASHLAAAGVPIIAVQQLLGHATITMTMRYAHLAPSALRDAVAVLGPPAASITEGAWATGGQRAPDLGPPTTSPSQSTTSLPWLHQNENSHLAEVRAIGSPNRI